MPNVHINPVFVRVFTVLAEISVRGGLLSLALLFLLPSGLLAQQERLVLFTDKAGTAHSLERPLEFLSQRALDRRTRQGISLHQRDLPVSRVYTDSLRRLGADVLFTTKWLNGCVVRATPIVWAQIERQGFVRNMVAGARTGPRDFPEETSSPLSEDAPTPSSTRLMSIDYGTSFTQNNMLGLDTMHALGFKGNSMRIGVLDGGFILANTNPAFSSMKVIDTYDFVANEPKVYKGSSHGSQVLAIMAANLPGRVVGGAFEAEFCLYRTENNLSETRREEMNWLAAAERADSAGVDIIHSSLGYNIFFTNREQDYTFSQMDGNTTLITRAADLAAATGMLVVASNGNDGDIWWRKLTAPADGDSVLAVGAVDRDRSYLSFSSQGPTADGRIKPDVTAMGRGVAFTNVFGDPATGNGTSYSAPLVSSLAAGLWQALPHLNNWQLMELIRQSGSQANRPDSLKGFGIPSFSRAYYVVSALEDGAATPEKILIYPNPSDGEQLFLSSTDGLAGKKAYAEILNAEGKLLYSQQIDRLTSSHTLHHSSTPLRPGAYFLRLSVERKVFFSKFIVQP